MKVKKLPRQAFRTVSNIVTLSNLKDHWTYGPVYFRMSDMINIPIESVITIGTETKGVWRLDGAK